jgi:hypothetical protein
LLFPSIGEDRVVRGLFQTIRENIPLRVLMEFNGEEEEEEELDDKEQLRRRSNSNNALEGDEDEEVKEETGDMDDGGVVDMLPWSLNIIDYTPKKVRKNKKKAKMQLEEDTMKISPKDKLAAVSKLIKIGTYLVWRALSSFCGVLSTKNRNLKNNEENDDFRNSGLYSRRNSNNKKDNSNVASVASLVITRDFDHSSSDDDMNLLCLLSRCTDNSIRSCALGALATAASNDVMGDHIVDSEVKRHHHRHVHKNISSSNGELDDLSSIMSKSLQTHRHLHRRSWEDHFLDVIDYDKDEQCRLNATSVLCSLVGASASTMSSSRITSGGALNSVTFDVDDQKEEEDASHIQRRIRIASNIRAAHILSKRMLSYSKRKSNNSSNQQMISDEIARRCAFILCEMSLVADQLANRDEMYSYATQQVSMLDHVTAKLGADTLTSLVQNEEHHDHDGGGNLIHSSRQLNHPQHPQTVIGVVQRCVHVLKSMERCSTILSIHTDPSVRLRVDLLISLHRTLYSMLHRTPTSLSLLVDQQREGSSMLLRSLDMPFRHSSAKLRFYCLNSLWIMCHHSKCAKHLIDKGKTGIHYFYITLIFYL